MSDKHMFGRDLHTRDKISLWDKIRAKLCDAELYPSYKHVNSKGETYYLNFKNVQLRAGKIQTIYFFSKEKRGDTKTILPKNFKVRENPRNGFLTMMTAEMQRSEKEGERCG